MSWVTNMLVSVDLVDDEQVVELSDWLRHECPVNGPTAPRDAQGVGWLAKTDQGDAVGWGGNKRPECTVWAGVLNHADLDAVLKRVATIPWREPQWVQVLLMDQEEATFRLYMFENERLSQFAPVRDDDGPHSY